MTGAVQAYGQNEASPACGGLWLDRPLCARPQAGPSRHVEPGGGAAEVVKVPTSELANGEEAPFNGGVLRSDADLDGGCAWVEYGDDRTAIAWPLGFGALFTGGNAIVTDGRCHGFITDRSPISSLVTRWPIFGV